MKRIITKISNGEEYVCKEFVPISPQPIILDDISESSSKVFNKKPNRNEKVNKKQKKKSKKEDSLQNSEKSKKTHSKRNISNNTKLENLIIKVPAEVCFSNPLLSVFDLKNPSEAITNGYVLLTTENLMTSIQKIFLNPMIVKVEKLENLDVNTLKLEKIKSVFVRYNVPFVAQGKTLEREVAQTIRFNESHAHFTDKVPPARFMEFMQSRRFLIEICGIREPKTDSQITPKIFGSQYEDKYVSKRMIPCEYIINYQNNLLNQFSDIEVLAVASYDLTPLLTPRWNYTVNECCHNPDNLILQDWKPHKFNFTESVTTNNINLKVHFKSKSKSPLTELNLLENGTSLKIEVFFLAPTIGITSNIVNREHFYNRMLLIIFSREVAVNLLNDILIKNQAISQDIIVPNITNSLTNLFELESKYLTGFVLDNGNSYVFFLEGSHKYELKNIWNKHMKTSPNEMIIFFNTELIFNERLYIYFFRQGGLCIITLVKPLRDILADEKFYIEGNVPLPCWEAAKKLDLLFRCTTLHDMLQYNLFPSPDELLSLDLEWGVPMRWNEALNIKSIK